MLTDAGRKPAPLVLFLGRLVAESGRKEAKHKAEFEGLDEPLSETRVGLPAGHEIRHDVPDGVAAIERVNQQPREAGPVKARLEASGPADFGVELIPDGPCIRAHGIGGQERLRGEHPGSDCEKNSLSRNRVH